jgi:hypothetical protein
MYCHVSILVATWLKNWVGDQKCNKNQNRGTEVFDFKIGGSKSHFWQNRGTKSAIKPNNNNKLKQSTWYD